MEINGQPEISYWNMLRQVPVFLPVNETFGRAGEDTIFGMNTPADHPNVIYDRSLNRVLHTVYSGEPIFVPPTILPPTADSMHST